jgi:hypothetical protein
MKSCIVKIIIYQFLIEFKAASQEGLRSANGRLDLGKFHSLTFGHTLGSIKPLERIFNRGPYPIGGDGNTIWASGSNVIGPNDHRIIGPPSASSPT